MLRTTTSAMARDAANFDRIAGELQGVVAKVESVASELDAAWKGQTADATKAAIRRFQDAAKAQNQQLNDIVTKIQSAASRYDGTDADRASALQSAMGAGM